MAAPVRPSDFESLIVQPEDSLADAIVKVYVKLPLLVYQLTDYMFNSDGTLAEGFIEDICAVNCAEEETETS